MNCEAVSSIVKGIEGAKCDHNASPVLGCAGNLVCWSGQAIGSTGTCTRLVAEGQPCTGLGGLPCAAGSVCVRNATGGGTCSPLASCGTTTCDANSYCNYSLTPPACAPRAAESKTCNLSGDTGQIPCVEGTMCSPSASGGSRGFCLTPGRARKVACTTSCSLYPLQCVNGFCAALDPASCH
jgi:hypothetical protein